ncbi:two-component system sensor histidine kinase/response regulator [Bradyrhizobium sp. SSBR45G]|uniref:PAS domain-containing hybrid sensor histidine kinase/response regulator n=1 Tax=unclassified Bradyrhizobium TaxID=2631580 RepID=UPI0023429C99|nr:MULTISPECIES: PAS domain-containing sensor histidine kinase [unclassified Bradyrhizobium]GLH76672.1 two-component system sensor histidine kinase/response regulator [Bradyrhizobium sp. SSBR45G]GLH84285.1 two-component system sensor histidine kinase/response regulator [Bradyrhizobium sp. SSBR45R]
MMELERDQLADAFDALDSGVAILDRDQQVVFWNHWLQSASGIAPEQALGRTLPELFPQTALKRLTNCISDALSLGSSAFLTYSLNPNLLPLRTRAGLPLIHNATIRPFGSQLPYSHCLVQIVDVTVTTQRERVLRERQNARYDAVVESASDVIVTLDVNGIVQFANPAAVRETQYDRSELVGFPLGNLFEERHLWESLWQAVLTGGPSRSVELVARRKDGTRTFLDVSASKWSSEGRIFVTAILRDVNERHAAVAALRDLNLTLEQRVTERTQERDRVWQASLDMLGVADADGRWISINPAWTKILGWFPEDILGKTSDWLESPEDRRKMRDDVSKLAMPEQTSDFESSFRTREGNYRVLSWTAINVEGLLYCVARDITEQRRQQEALAKAEDALRQAQKMEAVGQLTGGLAHDFNNLLTGISGALELLRIRISQSRYKDVDRYISVAQGAANRAAALTHRLLAFSRRQTLDPKATEVNQLVAGMTDLIRNTVGPSVTVSMSEAPDLWITLVDPNQLENALLNLCINARDAMPDGGQLRIATANCDVDDVEAFSYEMQPGEYVRLSVSDTGSGMSDEVVKRAFDPFYTTKPLGQGTGLGLSMIYGFAKQSGGQVRIVSTLGEGTTMHLFLPRFHGPEHAASERQDFSATPRADAGETVLIVDDEPSVRMLVGEVLAELGYRAIEAADGASALQVLRSDARIDLLVTDVGLPGGMNGRQLADFGRTARPDLKILFITGYAEKAVMEAPGLDQRMAILTKPFAMDGLAKHIRDLLR